jgi:hypothetical protein
MMISIRQYLNKVHEDLLYQKITPPAGDSFQKPISLPYIQLFQLRLSPSEAEKSNRSANGCWESLINE